MVRARWVLLAIGTAALAVAVLVTDDVTARFVAGYVYAAGLAVLLVSERIIVSTRNRPETRLAAARQGEIGRSE
jgi:hypothetical protein